MSIRLTEKSSLGELEQNLQQAMVDAVSATKSYRQDAPVVMGRKINPYIRDYKTNGRTIPSTAGARI